MESGLPEKPAIDVRMKASRRLGGWRVAAAVGSQDDAGDALPEPALELRLREQHRVEVGVRVDEPGRDREAPCVDPPPTVDRTWVTNLADDGIADADVRGRARSPGAVDQRAARDHDVVQRPSPGCGRGRTRPTRRHQYARMVTDARR